MSEKVDKTKPREGRCNVKRGDGTYCHAFPVRDTLNGRCRHHNGRAVRGPAHHAYKTGKYSKAAGEIRGAIETVRGSAELVDMTETLAHLRGSLNRMLDLVEERDTPDYRRQIQEAVATLGAAMFSGEADPAQISQAFKALKSLAQRGADDVKALEAYIRGCLDYGGAQKKTWDVALNAKHAVPAAKVAEFAHKIEESVQASVTDKDEQRAVLTQIQLCLDHL